MLLSLSLSLSPPPLTLADRRHVPAANRHAHLLLEALLRRRHRPLYLSGICARLARQDPAAASGGARGPRAPRHAKQPPVLLQADRLCGHEATGEGEGDTVAAQPSAQALPGCGIASCGR